MFAAWGDNALYQLVDDGSFEAGASAWSLAGDAQVVQDSDDGMVSDGLADEYALELGPGASATSPPICVTEDSVAYRFLASTAMASKGKDLRVEVIYLNKKAQSKDLAVDAGASDPTKALKLAEREFRTDSTVSLRFSSLNDATVLVDDVYMDPMMH